MHWFIEYHIIARNRSREKKQRKTKTKMGEGLSFAGRFGQQCPPEQYMPTEDVAFISDGHFSPVLVRQHLPLAC